MDRNTQIGIFAKQMFCKSGKNAAFAKLPVKNYFA